VPVPALSVASDDAALPESLAVKVVVGDQMTVLVAAVTLIVSAIGADCA
jgi:hypothetical protein